MNSAADGASRADAVAPGPAPLPPAPPPWKAWALLLAALAAWRVFFSFYDAHTALGPSIVPPLGPAAPADSVWTKTGTWHLGPLASTVAGAGGAPVFRLESTGGVCGAASFPILSWAPGVAAFRVTARVRCENVVPGRESYQTARIILYHRDSAGRPHFEWPHSAVALRGTRPWRRIEYTFGIPPFSRGGEVTLAQQGTGGRMEVADLAVTPMRVTRGHGWVVAGGGALWGLAALLWAGRLRLHRRRWGLGVIAVALAIVVGMLLPERSLEWTEATVVAGIAQAVGAPDGSSTSPATATAPGRGSNAVAVAATSNASPAAAGGTRAGRWLIWRPGPDFAGKLRQKFDVHKPGHIAAFALLGLATIACFLPLRGGAGQGGGRRWLAVIGGLLIYSYAAEQLQWLTLTRHAKLSDAMVNVGGIALGVALAALARRWLARRRA